MDAVGLDRHRLLGLSERHKRRLSGTTSNRGLPGGHGLELEGPAFVRSGVLGLDEGAGHDAAEIGEKGQLPLRGRRTVLVPRPAGHGAAFREHQVPALRRAATFDAEHVAQRLGIVLSAGAQAVVGLEIEAQDLITAVVGRGGHHELHIEDGIEIPHYLLGELGRTDAHDGTGYRRAVGVPNPARDDRAAFEGEVYAVAAGAFFDGQRDSVLRPQHVARLPGLDQDAVRARFGVRDGVRSIAPRGCILPVPKALPNGLEETRVGAGQHHGHPLNAVARGDVEDPPRDRGPGMQEEVDAHRVGTLLNQIHDGLVDVSVAIGAADEGQVVLEGIHVEGLGTR